MEKTNEERVAYNNNAIFYLFPFKVKAGIDLLTISVSTKSLVPIKFVSPENIKHEQFFHDFLISRGYTRTNHAILEDKALHQYNDQYFRSSDQSKVELLYEPQKRYIPYLMIKIHDPNLRLISMFDTFFRNHRIHVKLSKVEIRFDFYTDSNMQVLNFLNQHVFYKNQKSLSSRCKTTFYTNDIRKNGKGIRIYYKKDLDCIRMELCLGRKSLAYNKIDFPLQDINDLDIDRFFKFIRVDFDKILKYLYWSNREQINKLAQCSPISADLLKLVIRNWLDSKLSDDTGDCRYLMKAVEGLKYKSGISNYSRFLAPMADFGAEFKRQIVGQKFLG